MRKGLKIQPTSLIFSCFHFAFILHLVKISESFYPLIGLLILPFYGLLQWEPIDVKRSKFLPYLLAMTFGFYATFLLQQHIAVVAAATIPALAFAFFPGIKKEIKEAYSPIIYAGCFAGMAVDIWVPSLWMGLVVVVPGTLFYLIFEKSLLGVGGKLGTIGFSSLLMVWIIYWLR